MAADEDEEIDALFASDCDDDDFDPAAPAKADGAQPAAESEPDEDDQQPAPVPRKPLETAATCVPSTALVVGALELASTLHDPQSVPAQAFILHLFSWSLPLGVGRPAN